MACSATWICLRMILPFSLLETYGLFTSNYCLFSLLVGGGGELKVNFVFWVFLLMFAHERRRKFILFVVNLCGIECVMVILL